MKTSIKAKILIVDDNIEILEILSYQLTKAGYAVCSADSAECALQLLETETVDMAVMDIMMPGMDGLELCTEMRKKYFFPILFLSAKTSDDDKSIGLSCGADDYLVKPFSSKELLARINALLRRNNIYNAGMQSSILRLHNLIFDRAAGTIRVHNCDPLFTDIEYKILTLLLENRGKTLTNETIFTCVWHAVFTQTAHNTIGVHIKNIRKKIAGCGDTFKYIHTVWGVGYVIR